ncbi:hypothetical protein MARCHEWKA_01430 [Brevundimonas phage vB_BpoS-Marchewka]|uniref:Uncharacterized protein n=1 Tax=Brevundimonas phage vB_BpoS-Marchewka TaxID=2948604 RepID=A0A9E7SSE1_9CAUD|nr:hypothetical protein MARCHEWKA_01430 [Brevundimonas phage vB_BpoS-Marchewka]
MTTARIQLFQLNHQSRNNAPEAVTFACRGAAIKAQVQAAANRLGYIGSDPETLRETLTDNEIETIKPLDQIEALDDLTDNETVMLAEKFADFQSDIHATWAEVDVYTLTEAIRAAGAVPVVFTTDDLTDRYGGDDPEGWLRDNSRRIEDLLSERGNQAIDDLLAGDGLLRSEDDDDDNETTASAAGYSVVFSEKEGDPLPYTAINPEGDEVVWAVSEDEAWAGAVDVMNGAEPDQP